MKVRLKFFELPLKDFHDRYPAIPIPAEIDMSDPDYIVRFIPAVGDRPSMYEIGYAGDAWQIK